MRGGDPKGTRRSQMPISSQLDRIKVRLSVLIDARAPLFSHIRQNGVGAPQQETFRLKLSRATQRSFVREGYAHRRWVARDRKAGSYPAQLHIGPGRVSNKQLRLAVMPIRVSLGRLEAQSPALGSGLITTM
jgi:hypothetical protein